MKNKKEPLESFVVVESSVTYKDGIGYTGHILKLLGFPLGPYSPAGAKIFVRQAKTIDPKKKFRIEKYIRGQWDEK